MNARRLGTGCAAVLSAALCLAGGPAWAGGIEDSYHGQLGHGTGTGMLEKWCALPNFSFEQQGGIEGWTQQSCNGCHVGAAWNPEKPWGNCFQCHSDEDFVTVEMDACLACHVKDTEKRGDLFVAAEDVHIAAGLVCVDCHAMANQTPFDHQFLKGTAIDTTEPTMEGTLSCTSACHDPAPHAGTKDSDRLNRHVAKVACETCHTGTRPAAALAARRWNQFNADGGVQTVKHEPNWLPEHKWYDATGAGAAGDYLLPILGYTERRGAPGARIYPFNAVSVSWFVKSPESAFDDVIIVPEVKAADANGDGTVTLEEMRTVYPQATLLTEDMNFSISHSVLPREAAFGCDDCHGHDGWVLDWAELGYAKDPYGHFQYRVRNPKRSP
jgi:methanogenesis multiheme c-type cytochrome